MKNRIINAIIFACLFPLIALILEFGFYKWAPISFMVDYKEQVVNDLSCLDEEQDLLFIRDAKRDVRAYSEHELQALLEGNWVTFRKIPSGGLFYINAGTDFRGIRRIIPPLPQGTFRWQTTLTFDLPYRIERTKTITSNEFNVICNYTTQPNL